MIYPGGGPHTHLTLKCVGTTDKNLYTTTSNGFLTCWEMAVSGNADKAPVLSLQKAVQRGTHLDIGSMDLVTDGLKPYPQTRWPHTSRIITINCILLVNKL